MRNSECVIHIMFEDREVMSYHQTRKGWMETTSPWGPTKPVTPNQMLSEILPILSGERAWLDVRVTEL